jgi:transposase
VLKAQIKRRPAMKKVSTVVAKASRNISQQKLTIGLDLGDRNSWYCVLDEAARVQIEQRVRTSAKTLREVFGAMPRSRVGLEIGTHSPWISHLLSELGHEVIVANARKVRLIGESRKKDDRLDAQTLARLARIDPVLLCPVKHRSAKAQADLMMIRARLRFQHRLKPERPVCTERNESLPESANGNMATVATRRRKTLSSKNNQELT